MERNVDFYNLDAIISVGYRVNSLRATQFRQWTTKILRNFAIHGNTAAESSLFATPPLIEKSKLPKTTTMTFL